jgi:hypothetical protein
MLSIFINLMKMIKYQINQVILKIITNYQYSKILFIYQTKRH